MLPSNVNTTMFNNNMPSEYTTKLATQVLLEGRWVVGLTEIHIPCIWYNITKGNSRFQIHKWETSVNDPKPHNLTFTRCKIKPNFYESPQDIAYTMNKCIINQDVTIAYNTTLRRMVVKSPQINRSVTFYDGAHWLADMLGFKHDEVHLRHIDTRADVPSAVAQYPVDMTGGVNGICVQ